MAARPAGIDDGVRVAVELLGEQLGDGPVVAGRAVVGRHACAVEQRGALGAGASRKPSSDGGGRRLRRVLQDRERRDADAAADEDRPPPRRTAA